MYISLLEVLDDVKRIDVQIISAVGASLLRLLDKCLRLQSQSLEQVNGSHSMLAEDDDNNDNSNNSDNANNDGDQSNSDIDVDDEEEVEINLLRVLALLSSQTPPILVKCVVSYFLLCGYLLVLAFSRSNVMFLIFEC